MSEQARKTSQEFKIQDLTKMIFPRSREIRIPKTSSGRKADTFSNKRNSVQAKPNRSFKISSLQLTTKETCTSKAQTHSTSSREQGQSPLNSSRSFRRFKIVNKGKEGRKFSIFSKIKPLGDLQKDLEHEIKTKKNKNWRFRRSKTNKEVPFIVRVGTSSIGLKRTNTIKKPALSKTPPVVTTNHKLLFPSLGDSEDEFSDEEEDKNGLFSLKQYCDMRDGKKVEVDEEGF